MNMSQYALIFAAGKDLRMGSETTLKVCFEFNGVIGAQLAGAGIGGCMMIPAKKTAVPVLSDPI